MPIVAWMCPVCDREVDLPHFAETVCGEKVDAAFVQRVYEADGARDRGGVHVTDGMGCPRKTAILAQENVAVDPTESTATFKGQAVHKYLEGVNIPGRLSEVAVRGTLAGVSVQGTMDVWWPERGLVEDYKVPHDMSIRGLKASGPKPEHVAQISMYAVLIFQMAISPPATVNGKPVHEHTPTRGIIRYLGGSEHVTCAVTLMGAEEALALKVYGSDWTISQLLQATSNLLQTVGGWKEAPMYGEAMEFGGKSMCDYCAVAHLCKTQRYGAAF